MIPKSRQLATAVQLQPVQSSPVSSLFAVLWTELLNSKGKYMLTQVNTSNSTSPITLYGQVHVLLTCRQTFMLEINRIVVVYLLTYISQSADYLRVRSTTVPSVACQTTEDEYHSTNHFLPTNI